MRRRRLGCSGTASAGSAPAASLKHVEPRGHVVSPAGIRGVCPRGLIEARGTSETRCSHHWSIRGVCPRGLIEARARPHEGSCRSGACASAGSAPAASLKPTRASPRRPLHHRASAGSAPAASLKPVTSVVRKPDASLSIRGVCPRGLIEAIAVLPDDNTRARVASAGSAPAASLKPAAAAVGLLSNAGASAGSAPAASLKRGLSGEGVAMEGRASAGSAPAASLKRATGGRAGVGAVRIRGVCPRGLIEARPRRSTHAATSGHPRGLPPRPH